MASDIVLDFFAGSGSTGEAILDLNRREAGNRRFVLVQLPEELDPANANQKEAVEFCDATGKPRTLVEITKERVRRVIDRFGEDAPGRTRELELGDARAQTPGFQLLRLAESNFRAWHAEASPDAPALERQLELHVDHIRPNRTAQDILHEILLKSGFPLTTMVETMTIEGKTVSSVAGGTLLVCLERELTNELVRAIAERKPERVVCLDAGFAGKDQLKANAVQIFRSKGVTSFKTV
jgi:adenine-specific DNA-methyltransferase